MRLATLSMSGAVGTITLEDPAKLNAFGAALVQEVLEAFDASARDGARVLVLRAADSATEWSGGRFVQELPTNGRDPLTYEHPLRQLVRAIKELPTPVIAMIEGTVAGGACEVVMSCDLVIASETATFAFMPARIGVPYDIEGALNFMQAVPLQVIKELLFTADPITARRALEVGLVNRVVPADRLEAATAELAGQIAQNSPLVIALLKEQLRVLSEAVPLTPEGFERLQALRRRIYDSADYQEGVRAYLEQRTPRFQGR